MKSLKKRGVTSQESQVSGLRENLVLSVQNKYVCGQKLSYNVFPSLHLPHHPHQQEQLDNGEGES